jgi:hypothetical protein
METPHSPLDRLMDRLAAARHRLESSRRHAAAFTVLAAVFVAGGLGRLAVDETVVEVALPEPPAPAVQEVEAPHQLGPIADSTKLATAGLARARRIQ